MRNFGCDQNSLGCILLTPLPGVGGGGLWDFEKFYGAAGAENFFEPQAKSRFSSWKTCPKAVRNAQEASWMSKKIRCAAPVRRYHLGNEFVCKPARGWYASAKALSPANSPAILGRANNRNNGSERHGRPPESHEVRAFLSKSYCACVSGMRMSWHCAAHRSWNGARPTWAVTCSLLLPLQIVSFYWRDPDRIGIGST